MQIFLMFLATISAGVWVYLHYRYRFVFDEVLAGIREGEYPLSEIFYIGFGFLQLIHYDMEQRSAKQKIKMIAEVYGKKYSTYYYYVLLGAKVSYVLTFIPIVLLLIGISGKTNLLFFGVIILGLLLWYLDELVNDKVMSRRDELLKAYPQMLSKLTLLVNAGMPIREAWGKVASLNEGRLYEEMRIAQEELLNGIAEAEVYKAFGERCAIKPIKKFSSLMIQNLKKGSAEVIAFLREMSAEAWEEKKHMVKRRGEKASSKLIIPIGMIFLGILIIIMVPLMGSFI